MCSSALIMARAEDVGAPSRDQSMLHSLSPYTRSSSVETLPSLGKRRVKAAPREAPSVVRDEAARESADSSGSCACSPVAITSIGSAAQRRRND